MIKIGADRQNKLKKISSADWFQVRSLSEHRFVKKIGTVDTDTLQQIKDELAKVFLSFIDNN